MRGLSGAIPAAEATISDQAGMRYEEQTKEVRGVKHRFSHV